MANRASGSRSATALATTLLFSALVLYCVKPDTWRFLFPWHPTLAVFAYGLITHPAVLLVRHGRRRLHWVLQAASTACVLLGIWAAFTHKAGLGKPHFTTWHSWTGIAALLLTLLEVAVGVAAMTFHASTVGTEKQCPWLKYTVLRRVHRALGLLAHGFATAAIVLGLRSHYGRQTLATALGDAVPLQLVVQALAVAPFASIVRHLWRRR